MTPPPSYRWLVCLAMIFGLVLEATPTAQGCYLNISAYADGAVSGYDSNGNGIVNYYGSGFDYSYCEGPYQCYHGYAIQGTLRQSSTQAVWDQIQGEGTGFSQSVSVTPGDYGVESLFYVDCTFCSQQVFVVQAVHAIHVLNPCIPDIAVIKQEYFEHDHPYRPNCEDFTQSVPYPSHYGFNLWNQDNDYAWAILRQNMVANVWCIGTNYGEARPLTSGYRNPVRNSQITPSGSFTGPHTYGWAADLDTPNSPNDTMYNELRNLAKQSTCGSACVEPRNISENHIHVDYRSEGCPANW